MLDTIKVIQETTNRLSVGTMTIDLRLNSRSSKLHVKYLTMINW